MNELIVRWKTGGTAIYRFTTKGDAVTAKIMFENHCGDRIKNIKINALEQQHNLTNEELYQSFIKLEAENERLHDVLESQRWIPVSSGKLPDEQTHVIVTIGNERFTSTQLCLYTSTSIFWKEYVKAWQPLPQPYKAESEDVE